MGVHLTGSGLDFEAFGHGTTMVTELLDDYEEGTFVVAMAVSGTGSCTINDSYKTCDYGITGRLCYVQGHIRSSAVSSPNGELEITGMPFTHLSLVSDRATFALWFYGLTASSWTAGDWPLCYMSSGQSKIRLQRGRAGVMSADLAEAMTAATELNFSGQYTVAT